MRRRIDEGVSDAGGFRGLQSSGKPGRRARDYGGGVVLAAVAPARGRGLRVQIDQHHWAAGSGGLYGEMQRDCGFARTVWPLRKAEALDPPDNTPRVRLSQKPSSTWTRVGRPISLGVGADLA